MWPSPWTKIKPSGEPIAKRNRCDWKGGWASTRILEQPQSAIAQPRVNDPKKTCTHLGILFWVLRKRCGKPVVFENFWCNCWIMSRFVFNQKWRTNGDTNVMSHQQQHHLGRKFNKTILKKFGAPAAVSQQCCLLGRIPYSFLRSWTWQAGQRDFVFNLLLATNVGILPRNCSVQQWLGSVSHIFRETNLCLHDLTCGFWAAGDPSKYKLSRTHKQQENRHNKNLLFKDSIYIYKRGNATLNGWCYDPISPENLPDAKWLHRKGQPPPSSLAASAAFSSSWTSSALFGATGGPTPFNAGAGQWSKTIS